MNMRILPSFFLVCISCHLDVALAFSNAWTRASPIRILTNFDQPLHQWARTTALGHDSTIRSTFTEEAYNGEDDCSKIQSYKYFRGKWSDFVFGANYVNSRYLELFWEYNFQRTIIPWVIPLLTLLVATQTISPIVGSRTFDFLKNTCTAVFLASSALGGLLTLPFDLLRWTVTLTPSVMIPMFDYLPSKSAIQLVTVLLEAHSALNFLAQSTLVTVIAVMFWRPMIEEIQYRYLLSKLIGKGRNDQQQRPKDNSETSSMVKFIPVNGSAYREKADHIAPNPRTEKSQSLSKSRSRRQFICSLVFATTRLGWLCAHPKTVDPSLPFFQTAVSPYSWTVAFLQSVTAHFSNRVLSELSPLVQRSLLLLAIQQTVSTFFVAWYVFLPLYEDRGIAASVGAHMAWTFGKMTWPVRLVWRALASVSDTKNTIVPSSLKPFSIGNDK